MTNEQSKLEAAARAEQLRLEADKANAETRLRGNVPVTSDTHSLSMASANLSANNMDEQGLAIKRAGMMGLNGPVIAPLITEQEREYTVQHTLLTTPDGRSFSAGQQLSAEDLQGAVGSEAVKKAAVERYLANGSIVKTSDLKAHIAGAVNAHNEAQKAAAPAGTATDDQVRLAVPPPSATVTPQMVRAAQVKLTPEQDAALAQDATKRDAEATLAKEAQLERDAQMRARAGMTPNVPHI